MQKINDILSANLAPYLDKNWIAANAVKKIEEHGAAIRVQLELGFPVAAFQSTVIAQLQKQFQSVGFSNIELSLTQKIEPHQALKNIASIASVKNVIAVASGKGGVGKSTTAVNLAFALHQAGARVGLLDADIYGPNQPLMLGVDVTTMESLNVEKNFKPLVVHGIQTISIGYLVDPTTPTIWRGPMVSGALQQLAGQTLWDSLDYLIIDMPPGTGDIPLTLTQKIPVSGAVLVTTPQEVAVADARKGLEMFRKMNIPILGVIENMALHTCSQCGHVDAIFGEGGGVTLARTTDVPFLGKLPLDTKIREAVSRGLPTVLAEPESLIAKQYASIALKMVAGLSLQPVNHQSKFPKIVVE